VDAICRDGLDPRRRAGQAHGPGEYFAGPGHSQVSVAYCKGGKKMIVFAVLINKFGLTCDKGNIVVVNKPEHQLPLFVLTFNGSGSTHAVPAVQQFQPQIARAQARMRRGGGRGRRRSPFVLNAGGVQARLAAQRQALLAQLSGGGGFGGGGFNMNFGFGDNDDDDDDDGDY
jgi:hypothetical protein